MRKQRIWIGLLILCLSAVLGACGADNSGSGDSSQPTATIDPAVAMQAAIQATIAAAEGDQAEKIAELLAELANGRATWQANPVPNYRIQVTYIPDTGGPNATANNSIYTLTVEDGVVADSHADCWPPNSCVITRLDLELMTVPGIFDLAQEALASGQFDSNASGLDLHPDYGFPRAIFFSEGPIIAWSVNEFEVLEP